MLLEKGELLLGVLRVFDPRRVVLVWDFSIHIVARRLVPLLAADFMINFMDVEAGFERSHDVRIESLVALRPDFFIIRRVIVT